MKKFAVTLLFIAFAVSLFAKSGFYVSPEVGYGYLKGSRVFTDDPSSYRQLAASGLEAGLETGYEFNNNLRMEAYFSYLFAFAGDMVCSADDTAKPGKISSDMSYTDYKAGLGVGYFVPVNENNRFRISGGIDFAGISNHRYSPADATRHISSEVEGNKVTSFGLYSELAWHRKVADNIEMTAAVHGCGNFAGWIRILDNHKWVDHFEKSQTKLFSIFGQIGVTVFCFSR